MVLDKHDTWTKGNSVGSAELFRIEHARFGEGKCGCLYTWVERELSFGWAQPSGAGGGGRACWLGESQMQKEEVGQIAGAEPAQRAAEPTAPPPPSKSDDDARIADIEAKMEALRIRLPDLEGKANKKERTAVNRELYHMENDDAYLTAMKRRRDGGRAAVAAADDVRAWRRLSEWFPHCKEWNKIKICDEHSLTQIQLYQAKWPQATPTTP